MSERVRPTEMIVVTTTTPNADEALGLARKLVEQNFAVCVQVIPGVRSIYEWEGKTVESDEHLLLIKAERERFDSLKTFISENHSYETPEIIALYVAGVSAKYKAWFDETLLKPGS